jgi:hypothetical protein
MLLELLYLSQRLCDNFLKYSLTNLVFFVSRYLHVLNMAEALCYILSTVST